MLGQLGWWDVGLEFEVDVHEWWSVRIEWEMMGMDGHKMLYKKWKWLMLSGSSWHFPKSLINQKLMLFYLKCYLHGILGWHECTDAVGADVSQTIPKKDVYVSWNWMRLNLIWNDVLLVACKTNYWDNWWGGILPQKQKYSSLILKINCWNENGEESQNYWNKWCCKSLLKPLDYIIFNCYKPRYNFYHVNECVEVEHRKKSLDYRPLMYVVNQCVATHLWWQWSLNYLSASW